MSLTKSKVSVISTVWNEQESIGGLLHSLTTQTRPPDEVVICDGGSTDDTVARISDFAKDSPVPIRLLVRVGANISAGRNVAIEAATGDVIAVTDAGVRLSPLWLEKIVEPFEDPKTQTVGGFFIPDPQTTFETAMGATVLPQLSEIDPEKFLPSSRSVAFRKSAWATAGGYPEWLDYCEDLIYDFQLRDQHGPFHFAPEAIVHFRPRSSLRAFFTQYYRYARGDGKADLFRKRHAVRYGTYLVAVPCIVALAALLGPWWLALYLGTIPAMFLTGWRRLARADDLSLVQKLQAAPWVPVIRVTGDLAKMAGYPAGLIWRWNRRTRSEVHWQGNLISQPEPASAGSSRKFAL
ncbi:MAG: glycosyltransferase [Chloroflexi bacterium]|nr:glycosyltransferase [Chloroflexota bacterium]